DESLFDAFLSHASPDKPWVETLKRELSALGLSAYLDQRELKPGDNFVLALDDGLRRSRFLVLVLSGHTARRPCVEWEGSTLMADRGPLGRIVPVRIDDVPLPHAILTAQAIHALDRDAGRVARLLLEQIGRPDQLPPEDARRRYLGQHLVFSLRRQGEQLG